MIEPAISPQSHHSSMDDHHNDSLLSQFGLKMAFARDEEIFAQEEDTDLIYQVIRGVVRTMRLTADGRRQIGDFYYPGQLFGLEHGAIHRYSAEALSDCVILTARRSALRLAAGEAALQAFLSTAMANELERTQDHLILLGRKTAGEKVAAFLIEAASRASTAVAELPMTRQDMADYLGLTIETVSRMITKLQAKGDVEFQSTRQFKINNIAGFRRFCAG